MVRDRLGIKVFLGVTGVRCYPRALFNLSEHPRSVQKRILENNLKVWSAYLFKNMALDSDPVHPAMTAIRRFAY